jgi:hypothetical protein
MREVVPIDRGNVSCVRSIVKPESLMTWLSVEFNAEADLITFAMEFIIGL